MPSIRRASVEEFCGLDAPLLADISDDRDMEEDNSEEGSASDEEVGIPHAHHPHPVIPSHIVTNASFTLAVLSLAKTIMGSGMLVLPKAFQMLGCILGSFMMIVVGAATWFTVHGLVYAAEKMGKATYASVVRTACGRPAKWGLLAAIFGNCLGMCVVFLVIYADILVGTAPEFNGLFREFLPWLEPGDWLLDRTTVCVGIILCFLLPFSLQKDLARLGPLAMLGVGSVGVFAASAVLLWVVAAWQGNTFPLPWLPDWAALANDGSEGRKGMAGLRSVQEPSSAHLDLAAGGSSAAQALVQSHLSGGLQRLGMSLDSSSQVAQWANIILGIAAVSPLILNADICHQSVFPAMSLLHPYRRKSFNNAVATALMMCNVLYTIISVAALATFGPALQPNILASMNAVGMAPVLGVAGAHTVALLVRVSYFVSLLGSFVFTFAPLRHCVMEVVLGSSFPVKRPKQAEALFLPITLLLLALVFTIAVTVPGIWLVLSLLGSLTSTVMGFIFPALVILTVARDAQRKSRTRTLKRVVSTLLIIIGIFLFFNGFSVLRS